MCNDELTRLQRDWIKQLTADNMHLEAHKTVAEIANHSKAAGVFKALIDLQDYEGEVTHEMYLIETKWRKYLYTWIDNGHGGQAGKEAKRCL